MTDNANQISIEQAFESTKEFKQRAFDAQVAYEAELAALATAFGSTFQVNGQWMQVRSGESTVQGRKITYLCALKGEPKTWLGVKRGPRKTKTVPTLEQAIETAGAVTTAMDNSVTVIE